jgi:hypothetical protein
MKNRKMKSNSRSTKENEKRRMKTFRRLIEMAAHEADQVVISEGAEFRYLEEGKWLKGDFDNEIRVDRNTHMRSGERHAHIYDRKGNQLYALTQQGRPSHGSKTFKLTKSQTDALRSQGFTIPKSRIVEAMLIVTAQMTIYG